MRLLSIMFSSYLDYLTFELKRYLSRFEYKTSLPWAQYYSTALDQDLKKYKTCNMHWIKMVKSAKLVACSGSSSYSVHIAYGIRTGIRYITGCLNWIKMV